MIEVLNFFRRDKKKDELEKKVALLESQLVNVTQTLSSVTELALKMASEIDALARYVKSQNSAQVQAITTPKDDFYN